METSYKNILLIFLSIGILFFLPFIGITNLSFSDLFNSSYNQELFWQLRVPRVLAGFIAGGGLAICGAVYQAIFRNDLACPFSLGVSSGAAFGAALAAFFPSAINEFFSLQTIFASAGGLFTVFAVLVLSKLSVNKNESTLILSGLVVSFFFLSLVTLIQYLSNYAELFQVSRWMMGSVQSASKNEVLLMSLTIFPLTFILISFSKKIDLISLGDELAGSRGLNVNKTRAILFILSSIMVGIIVSSVGVIAFIGIMIPHMVRIVFGPRAVIMQPLCFLFGGLLLAVCDTLSRVVLPPFEIPVGVFTALLGGPFFLWLLIKGSKIN